MTSSRSGSAGDHTQDRGWDIDRWGSGGRPIVFINDPAFDRSIWWPVAADLADAYTVVVLEHRAGHPTGYADAALHLRAEQLGGFVAGVGRQKPVVVGHGRTVGVALAFGARFPARAVVTVGLRTKLPKSVMGAPHLVILGGAQAPDGSGTLNAVARTAQLEVYDTLGPCPHLADPRRFAADIRRLAG